MLIFRMVQERLSTCLLYKGCQYIRKWQCSTIVNILQLKVGYLNVKMNRKTQNAEPEIGPDGSSQTRWERLVDRYRQGLDRQEASVRVFGRFSNRTEPFFSSNPGPLVGYLDPLLTLGRERVASVFAYKRGQYLSYDYLQRIPTLITQDARPRIVDALLMLISKLGQGVFVYIFRSQRRPVNPKTTLSYHP